MGSRRGGVVPWMVTDESFVVLVVSPCLHGGLEAVAGLWCVLCAVCCVSAGLA